MKEKKKKLAEKAKNKVPAPPVQPIETNKRFIRKKNSLP